MGNQFFNGLTMVEPKTKVVVEQVGIDSVELVHLPYHPDQRGDLTVGEIGAGLPFVPQRFFVVFSVPEPQIRGDHAHLKCHQFMLCLKGSCKVNVDNGKKRVCVLLDDPTKGLYVPPMIWATEFDYSPDATLLVLASHLYDPADYIRDYLDYQALVNNNHG